MIEPGATLPTKIFYLDRELLKAYANASGDHNLEERASSTTKEPNQQNRFTPLENPLIKIFVHTPQPSAVGKDLLENLRTIPSIRPNTAPYPR